MKADAHISAARTRVNGYDLGRHIATRLSRGSAFSVASGLGPPRLWTYATDAVMEGCAAALSGNGAPSMKGLTDALESARRALAMRCDALIERMVPDAALTMMSLDAGNLHIASAGAGRVYLHRAGQPRRLTPRDAPSGGLLSVGPHSSTTLLEPEDIILCGSVSAFSVRAIARLASVLEADPRTPPSVLASLLVEPATKAGVGAAAIVLRVR